MSLFSGNLRFLRKKGNHKQDEISVLFGKRANTIGNWENGKSEPNMKELMKLSEYFKVNVQDLLHTDLAAGSQIDRNEMSGQRAIEYGLQEPYNSITRESEADTFWLILRELRSIREKVDLLVSGIGSSGFIKHSDKSNH